MNEIKRLIANNPKLEICANKNGIKFGVKSTHQSDWKRLNWTQVSKLTKKVDDYSVKMERDIIDKRDATRRMAELVFGGGSAKKKKVRCKGKVDNRKCKKYVAKGNRKYCNAHSKK